MSAVDGAQLELVATAPSQQQAERWVRAFVMAVGVNYVEKANTSRTLLIPSVSGSTTTSQSSSSIHAYTIDIGDGDGSDGLVSLVSGQRRVVPFSRFTGHAILVINVDVGSPHAQTQFAQLQVRFDFVVPSPLIHVFC